MKIGRAQRSVISLFYLFCLNTAQNSVNPIIQIMIPHHVRSSLKIIASAPQLPENKWPFSPASKNPWEGPSFL